MNSIPASKSRLIFNTVCFAFFVIGLGFYFIATPYIQDDFWFMIGSRPWYEAQGIVLPQNGGDIFKYGIPIEAIWKTWETHYLYDNARLTNILATVFLILPKWVGSGLMTILTAWSVILTMRFAGISFRSRLVPLLLFMWACVIPWHNTFGSLVFQFNYVLPGCVGLIWLLFLKKRVDDGRPPRCWWVLIVSLLIGLLHEGFSVSLAFSLLALALYFRRWRTPYIFTSAIALLVGAAVLLAVPGMQMRFALASRPYMHLPALTIFVVAVKLCFYVALVSMIIWLIYRHSGILRRYVSGSILPILCTASLVVFIVLRPVSGGGPRVAYWLVICLTMLILYTMRLFYWKFSSYLPYIPGVRWISIFLVAGMLFLSGRRLYKFDLVAIDFRSEMNHVREMLYEGRDGGRLTFYLNLPYDTFKENDEINLIKGGFYKSSFAFYKAYLKSANEIDTVGSFGGAVPAIMRNVTSESGVPVGNAGNIRKVGDEYFVVNPEKCVYLIDPYHFIYVSMQGDHRSDNRRVNGWFNGIRFYSEADGKRYMWLYRKEDF